MDTSNSVIGVLRRRRSLLEQGRTMIRFRVRIRQVQVGLVSTMQASAQFLLLHGGELPQAQRVQNNETATNAKVQENAQKHGCDDE